MSCKKGEDELFKGNFFSQTRLPGDSINLHLKMNEPQALVTTGGTMNIMFNVDPICYPEICRRCHLIAVVKFRLAHGSDTVVLDPLYLSGGCIQPPIYYGTVNCNETRIGGFGSHVTRHGNLIYNIKELYPYPNTRDELDSLRDNNKYSMNLTILNTCVQ